MENPKKSKKQRKNIKKIGKSIKTASAAPTHDE
jgi:hypothetical protein